MVIIIGLNRAVLVDQKDAGEFQCACMVNIRLEWPSLESLQFSAGRFFSTSSSQLTYTEELYLTSQPASQPPWCSPEGNAIFRSNS